MPASRAAFGYSGAGESRTSGATFSTAPGSAVAPISSRGSPAGGGSGAIVVRPGLGTFRTRMRVAFVRGVSPGTGHGAIVRRPVGGAGGPYGTALRMSGFTRRTVVLSGNGCAPFGVAT